MFNVFKKNHGNRKYVLTNDSKMIGCVTLYRIKAVKSFSNVSKGDLGGYIENESNLSHDGNCWVYDNAVIYDNSGIVGNGKIYNDVTVKNYSKICDDVTIKGRSLIMNSTLRCRADILDDVNISNSKIGGRTTIRSASSISDSTIAGNAYIGRDSNIQNSTIVDTSIYGATIANCTISGDGEISGPIYLECDGCKIDTFSENIITSGIFDGADIASRNDYLSITPLGSENRTLNIYRGIDTNWKVATGCFCGTIDEFISAVEKIHRDCDGVPNNYYKEYMEAINYAKLKLSINEKEKTNG